MAYKPRTWEEYKLLHGNKNLQSSKYSGSITNPRVKTPRDPYGGRIWEEEFYNKWPGFEDPNFRWMGPPPTRPKIPIDLDEAELLGNLDVGEIPSPSGGIPAWGSEPTEKMKAEMKGLLDWVPEEMDKRREEMGPLSIPEKVFDPQEYRKSMIEKQRLHLQGKGEKTKGWGADKWMARNKYIKDLQEQQDLRYKQRSEAQEKADADAATRGFSSAEGEKAWKESLPGSERLRELNLAEVARQENLTEVARQEKEKDDSRSLLSEAVEGKETKARQFARTFNPQSNADVKKMQGYLQELGFLPEGAEHKDGILGPQTEKALRKLQGVKYTSPAKKVVKNIVEEKENVIIPISSTSSADVTSTSLTDVSGATTDVSGDTTRRDYTSRAGVDPVNQGWIPDDFLGITGLGTRAFWNPSKTNWSGSEVWSDDEVQ